MADGHDWKRNNPRRPGSGKVGGITEEEEAALFEKEKADMKKRMTERNEKAKAEKAKRNRTGITNRTKAAYGTVKNNSEKLDVAVSHFLSTLVKDAQTYNDRKNNAEDAKDNRERRTLLNLIKDEVSVIKQLRELREALKEEIAREQRADLVANPENVTLMEDARKALKAAGLKAEL